LTTTATGTVKAAMSSDEMRSLRSGEALRCAVPQCLSSLRNVVGGAPLADGHEEKRGEEGNHNQQEQNVQACKDYGCFAVSRGPFRLVERRPNGYTH